MRKSVAIIVCAWPPQGGGIGNNAYYHAIKLAERGYQIGVFTPNFSGISLSKSGINFFNLPTFLHFGKAGFLIGLWKQLKDYQIIHLYYPFFGTDLIIWLYKKVRPSVKLVLHYEMDPIGQGIKGVIFKLHIKMFLGGLVKSADKIGVLSFDHARNSYLAPYLLAMPNKFIELPNGIDTEIFKPLTADESLKRQYNIGSRDLVMVFVGGLDRQHYFKGVPILLESFKKMPKNYFPNILEEGVQRGVLQELRGEAKLLIIGDGDLRKQFEDYARNLGVSDRVIFTGWIKNEELAKYYALADVFVLPSTDRTESFGIVVAEAQACGLSAVISDWPGVRTTIIDGQTGYLVKPGDVDDLTYRLTQLFNNKSLREQMGRSGTINSVNRFDWKKIIEQLNELYSNL